NADTHALVVPEFQNLEEHRRMMMDKCKGDLKEAGLKHLQANMEQMSGNEIYQYRYFIGVKLKQTNVKGLSMFREFLYILKDFKRYLTNTAGVDAPEILLEEIQAYQKQEEL